jgi:hypothetical protein
MACSFSGECPTQSTTSPTTRTGSRVRYECVGLPGSFLSVTLGSSSNLTRRFDDVDVAAAVARSELGAPDRGVEGRGEVDVVHHAAGLEVRLAARHQQIAEGEVRLRAVQVDTRLEDLERHRLARRAHPTTLGAGAPADRNR